MNGVAEACVRHHRGAELAALHVTAGAHEQRVPPGVEVDHQVHVRLFGRRGNQEAIGDGRGERLLDEHVLASPQHGDRRVAVQVVGCRNADRLDVAACELLDARRPGAAEALTGAAGAVRIPVADHRQPGTRVRGQGERVIAAPDARADDAYGDGPVSHRKGYGGVRSNWAEGLPSLSPAIHNQTPGGGALRPRRSFSQAAVRCGLGRVRRGGGFRRARRLCECLRVEHVETLFELDA